MVRNRTILQGGMGLHYVERMWFVWMCVPDTGMVGGQCQCGGHRQVALW